MTRPAIGWSTGLVIESEEQSAQSQAGGLRRWWLLVPAIGGFLLGFAALWLAQGYFGSAPKNQPTVADDSQLSENVAAASQSSTTNIYAHNLRLHQGPSFRVYIQWLRGQLKPVHAGRIPSLDDPESFYLNVTNGVIHANLGDICNYLNAKSSNGPLTDIKISGTGDQVHITAKLHKGLTLPVELNGVLKPAANNRVQLQVTKIHVLHMPFKAVLNGLHITLASMLSSEHIEGLEVDGNDLYFDANKLLPPPYIRGKLTKISIASPDLEATYGDANKDVQRVGSWRNFLQLQDGNLNFGKLTMNKVDVMMIDISSDAWFDLDLAHYQDQLVNGYTRMTPDNGLQIFMPDVADLKTNRLQQMNIEWIKNRRLAPPSTVLLQER